MSTLRIMGLLAVWAAAALPAGVVRAADEASPDGEDVAAVTVEHGLAGQVLLTVPAAVQERIGLRVAQVAAATRVPQAQAYGTLQEDPAYAFTLRAPMGGFVRAAVDAPWPGLGQQLSADAVLGSIQPRFSAAESVDLLSRWSEADAEVTRLEAELEAARASYENKRRLNTNGGLISDRAVEESQALLAGDEANLAAARKKARAIAGLVKGESDNVQPFQLAVPIAGRVNEVLASPGECVDSGQALLRVTDCTRLIARVGLPAGTARTAEDAAARIVMLGNAERVLTGAPLGLAAARDPVMLGPTLLYRVEAGDAEPLQTGAAVIAYVPLAAGEISGVRVPRGAIVRLGGLDWVYLNTASETFERRQVRLDRPEDDAWFVTAGLADGDTVVSAGAQLLLSEEQKGQIESEEEASE